MHQNLQTLSESTLKTIANYRDASGKTLAACQAGGRRLVDVAQRALNEGVYPQAGRISKPLRERLQRVDERASSAIKRGLEQLGGEAEQAIRKGCDAASEQVAEVARKAAQVEARYLKGGIDLMARVNLPAAKLSLATSEIIRKGATAVADKIGVAQPPLPRAPSKRAKASPRRAVKPVAAKQSGRKTTPARVAKGARTATE